MTPADILARLLNVEGMRAPELTPLLTDEPKLPVYTTRIGKHSWGQGAHPDPVVAQLKAAGEALERHCLLTPDEDGSVEARYGELEGQIDPAAFYCYSPAQTDDWRGVIQELRDTPRLWTRVHDITANRPALVPREFVYLDAADLEARPIRRESLTSGGAVGDARSGDAPGRALFELIERDAFMGAWLLGKSPARIGGINGAAADLVGLLHRYRLDCRLFDIRNDIGVPAVLALTVDSSGIGPAVTTGLSAAERYEDAAAAAILESVSYRRQVRLNQIAGELPEVLSAAEIVSVETRVAYWSHPDRLEDLPPWFTQSPSLNLAELEVFNCTAEGAVARLANLGFRVFRAEVTTPAAAAHGFEAIRVIVPELHPLFLSEAAEALHSVHLGSIRRPSSALPHPFA